jgi:hypothetical protein
MTNPVDVRDVLATQIYNQFVTAQPTVEIYFSNHPSPENANEIHVIVEIMPGDNDRAEIGNVANPLVRHTGVVNVRVMIPQDTGTRAGMLVCDTIYGILFDQQYAIPGGGHVTTYGCEMSTRGVVNGWFATSVQCQYRAFIRLTRP